MNPFHPIALIPARAGSTRTPNKNTELIGGRTLVQRAVDCAVAVTEIKETWVSSDSRPILDSIVGPELRLKRHERKPGMSNADSPIEPLCQLIMGYAPEATHIVLLNPTSPFRTPRIVGDCIRHARMNRSIGTVATVVARNFHHYVWLWDERAAEYRHPWINNIDSDGNLRPRSQDLPPVWVEHGACYVIDRRIIESGRLFGRRAWPVLTTAVEAMDIDRPWELAACRGIAEWMEQCQSTTS